MGILPAAKAACSVLWGEWGYPASAGRPGLGSAWAWHVLQGVGCSGAVRAASGRGWDDVRLGSPNWCSMAAGWDLGWLEPLGSGVPQPGHRAVGCTRATLLGLRVAQFWSGALPVAVGGHLQAAVRQEGHGLRKKDQGHGLAAVHPACMSILSRII